MLATLPRARWVRWVCRRLQGPQPVTDHPITTGDHARKLPALTCIAADATFATPELADQSARDARSEATAARAPACRSSSIGCLSRGYDGPAVVVVFHITCVSGRLEAACAKRAKVWSVLRTTCGRSNSLQEPCIQLSVRPAPPACCAECSTQTDIRGCSAGVALCALKSQRGMLHRHPQKTDTSPHHEAARSETGGTLTVCWDPATLCPPCRSLKVCCETPPQRRL